MKELRRIFIVEVKEHGERKIEVKGLIIILPGYIVFPIKPVAASFGGCQNG
jgi:hypothetical protein